MKLKIPRKKHIMKSDLKKNQSRLVKSKEIELVIKNLLTKKPDFIGEFNPIFKELTNHLKKQRRQKQFPTHYTRLILL